jgi:nitrogen fixation NifU-like protein
LRLPSFVSKFGAVDLSELYQEIILDHSRHPRHRGGCPGETHRARAENPTCGDEVAVHLRLSAEGRVEEATFTGQGCALSQASASLLTAQVRGRLVAEVLATAAQVQRLCVGEGLPPDGLAALGDLQALQGAAKFPQRVKCATLAWHALEQALAAGNRTQAT